MKRFIALGCNATDASACSKQLSDAIERGLWVQLLPKAGEKAVIPNPLLPAGCGVVLSSGGSSAGPHLCFQPCSHLDQSAIATGQWLQTQGLEPKNCRILNPLPFHHVSGLMPWWRSRVWGCSHTWILPSLMRDPVALAKSFKSIFTKDFGPLIISLVPTHLERLLKHPAGLHWLQSFDVIWVGGAGLSERLAENARRNKIRLAPCYGSTETAAMVAALDPNAFLSGQKGCGNPLGDVELRLNQLGALEVKTPRLAVARLEGNRLEGLRDQHGWWQSGDAAKLTHENCLPQIEIIGRLDTAINSGGETVFPERLEARLLKCTKTAELNIQDIILLPVSDNQWGQRLVGLVRWQNKLTISEKKEKLKLLQELVEDWLPAERPFAWHECPELSQNTAGKWERSKWKNWLDHHKL
jgi:O-succinylbenzoic acid--CoA ligase